MTDGSCGYIGIVTGWSRVHARWVCGHDFRIVRFFSIAAGGSCVHAWWSYDHDMCHADTNIVTDG